MKRLIFPLLALLILIYNLALVHAAPPPQYTVNGSINLAPSTPQLTAIDPFASGLSPVNPLKPKRPFWYVVDKNGLTIMGLRTERTGALMVGGPPIDVVKDQIVGYVPWPNAISIAQPDGEVPIDPAVDPDKFAYRPAGGWEPVGITVSYPTDEALASSSETPPTYVYVVMKHSGFEWQSETNLPAGRDLNVRDKIVAQPDPNKDGSLLVQIDVSQPNYPIDLFPMGTPIGGGLLGRNAGQPAFDPATGAVYVGNMPTSSLPTTPAVPNDLTSFVSVVSLAPAELPLPGEVPAPVQVTVLCGPEHPDIPILAGVPQSWACIAEGGEGPFNWAFTNLPPWLNEHTDPISGIGDGILYGTPTVGTWTFQAHVDDNATTPPGTGDATITLTITSDPTTEYEYGELAFEAGIPAAVAIEGTPKGAGDPCALAPTTSPGSLVPSWVSVAQIPGRTINNTALGGPVENTIGCVVMGTPPISGEYYEFQLPNLQFTWPTQNLPLVISGQVAGPYNFDPLPAGVGLSGLAWHQINKIHDPSTEADILNREFFGVEPYTGQLYRIVPPYAGLEAEGTVIPPPALEGEIDAVEPYAELLTPLLAARTDIATILNSNQNLKVRFGDVAVEANTNAQVFVTASQISDPSGIDPTVNPIGGAIGSNIPIGALIKVSGARDPQDPEPLTLESTKVIALPGVQAYQLGLDSDLAPAAPGDPGQKDNGALWVTGTTTGNVEVVDTALGKYTQLLSIPDATSLGGVSVNPATRIAYLAGTSLQSVILFAPGTPSVTAPQIWSSSTTTFTVGSAGSFTFTATGSPTSMLSFAGTLPGEVTFTDNGDGTATLAGTPAAAGSYPITITAANGTLPNATQNFTLVISGAGADTAPVVTTHPTSQTIIEGQPVTFTAAASGTPIPTVQWQESTDSGLAFSDIAGATGPSYTIPATTAVMNGYQYRAVFTNSIGSATSNAATLTVTLPPADTAPVVTTQPTSQMVAEGQAVTFTAAASGIPTPTVQWQESTNSGSTFNDITGATGSSYTIPATTAVINGYQYRAIFTNSVGSATSTAATLTVTIVPPVISAPVVTTHPVGQTIAGGQAVTFTAAASGNPIPTVQWQESSNSGSTFTNIPGATATSYTIPATTSALNGYQYRAVFTNSVGSAASNAAILTVTLPPPWIQQNIGAVGVNGTVSFAGGTYTISGSGIDIWDNVDSFNYLYQPLVGDGQIVARVAGLQNVDPWSKGGVMIRANLAANSPHAMMVLTPGNGAAFQRRKTAGALSLHTAGPKVVAPYWVKLVRSGNLFSGYISPDGQSWALVGSDTVTMGSSVYVGLAITSGNNTKLCAATVDGLTITGPAPLDTTPPTVTAFTVPATSSSLAVPVNTLTASDDVAVTGYLITESATKPLATDLGWSASLPASYTFATAGSKTLYAWARDAAGNISDSRSALVNVTVTLPPPWIQQNIGTVGVAGTASFAAGTFAISGSGIDIWDYLDSFNYLYQPLVGDGQIVARVASLQNVDPWSKGGVMIRANLAANSPHAMMVLTPGNGAAFQRRKTPGAISLHTAGPRVVAPYWVKLVRSGNLLSGYISPDGQTWTLVGSDTVVMGSSVYVGLALTSGNNTQLCAATVDNLTISNPNVSDTTPPTVTAFTIPATSSLTVPITTLTATDDVAVTGYLITESATKPAATDPVWSAGKPASYTFATAGSKTLYAWARDAAGNVSDSRSATVVVTAAAGLTITGTVWQDMGSTATSITTPAITTTAGNQLLVAFIAASAPATGTNTAVTGVTSSGGLTWTRAVVNNAQRGTAEIWWTYAQSPVTATVTANLSQTASSGSITVMSFSGTANGLDAIGATGGSSAIGIPSASLVTTRANSLVLGVGNDWYGAVNHTVGPNQTMVHQFLSTGTSDTYWVQRQNQPTATAGTTVTINDTAPTRNMYNESILEIRTP